jgi:hypothetical protein
MTAAVEREVSNYYFFSFFFDVSSAGGWLGVGRLGVGGLDVERFGVEGLDVKVEFSTR